MPFPNDIAEYLEDQGMGTVGTDIFIGRLHDTPDDCITVYAYAGEEPDRAWNGEYPRLQIIVRRKTLEAPAGGVDAYARAYQVFNLFRNKPNLTMNGTLYRWIHPLHSPAQMGFDANKRPLIVMNFRIIKSVE